MTLGWHIKRCIGRRKDSFSYCNISTDIACSHSPSAVAELLVVVIIIIIIFKPTSTKTQAEKLGIIILFTFGNI